MNMFRSPGRPSLARPSLALLVAAALSSSAPLASAAEPPAKGDKAADFTLGKLGGGELKLSDALADGPVALIVLRGFPEYQCPACSRQVAEYVRHAEEFAAVGAQVVMVYPGPSGVLPAKAEEFMTDVELPEGFTLLLDPDYKFTNLYHLRWDAPRETAYPTTLVIGEDGVIDFAKVSKTHGGRTKADDALHALGHHSHEQGHATAE
ncbi:AhpC/TSA family protein [Pseudobythopirellula maris]|uniref:thioredoxin-dependent peroxiredoxin n=1 Tax=Pseudobythopirellula maris TaxID=2527991 RepID=A0A5C5ZTW3_9BACT|nr:peroxiredoxin family protein [Pseudobythopirellula maris]TWT90869.1 AhpC/TSA family protein [Pseudobythopirellula maris]